MKKTVVFIVIVAILFIYQIPNFAQEVEEEKSEITTTKMRLLILPSKGNTLEPHSIDNEVTSIITSVASNLGRFVVIDRNNLDNILKEQALQQTGVINDSMIVNFGKISAAKEALIVSVLNFSQKGVPKSDKKEDEEEENEGFFLSLIKLIFSDEEEKDSKEEEKYPHNIQTQLSVQVRKIDIETGQSLHAFNVSATHTGGTKGKSRAKVIKKLKNEVINKFKELYLLKSEVVSVDGGNVLLFLGANIGVRRGTIFEIIEPDEIKTFENKQIAVPGHSTGFVSVTNISGESNRSRILRQWYPIKPGYKALEFTRSIHALQFKFFTPFTDAYWSLGIQYDARPMQKFDFGGGIHYIMVTDTYNDRDSGFGFGGFGSFRFFNSARLDLNLKLDLDLDLVFRDDDENHGVSCGIVTAPVGICANVLLSPKSDIIIDAGYRLGKKTSNWNYTKDEKSVSGVWKDNAPEIDISGFYFSVGYKLFLF